MKKIAYDMKIRLTEAQLNNLVSKAVAKAIREEAEMSPSDNTKNELWKSVWDYIMKGAKEDKEAQKNKKYNEED